MKHLKENTLGKRSQECKQKSLNSWFHNERYYDPNYGTNLLKYIFDQNDYITAVDIQKEIKETVKKYIPALTISEVDFNWNNDDEGNPISDNQLNVKIKFTYNEEAFNETGEIDINF